MKKLYILASLAVAAASLTSCEADKEPVYVAPAEKVFSLSTPAEDDNIVLAPGQVVELTAVAPDYGIPVVTTYSVDLTLADEFIEANEETGTEANYITLTPKQPTKTAIELDDKDVTTAICQLLGINTFNEFEDADVQPQKVTVRANARIPSIASSNCVSNNVVLPSVTPYNPFPQVPGYCYLVGTNTDWATPDNANATTYEKWSIEETGVGTNIYIGSLNVPAGEQYFRFYTELTGWDGVCLGTPSGGNELIKFTDEETSLEVAYTQGCFMTDAAWEGGYVTFTIDLTDKENPKVYAKKGEYLKETYVYLIGTPSNWAEPSATNEKALEAWRLVDRGGTGIYKATFDIPESEVYFRIYPGLNGWGATPYAAAAGNANVSMTLGSAIQYVEGEGCWTFNWKGGKLTFVLDTVEGTMTVSVPEE
ncbi:SusE domain-containing protein [Duncaniella muris]|uniref:SusE domain-containing protein n=1 Tax=Duncaniella muris TaxID=2094150 RepID=UPI0025B07A7E|nr:SusE domain-containing protein [Duncaniella muris]